MLRGRGLWGTSVGIFGGEKGIGDGRKGGAGAGESLEVADF